MGNRIPYRIRIRWALCGRQADKVVRVLRLLLFAVAAVVVVVDVVVVVVNVVVDDYAVVPFGVVGWLLVLLLLVQGLVQVARCNNHNGAPPRAVARGEKRRHIVYSQSTNFCAPSTTNN